MGSLDVAKQLKIDIQKKLFKLKPANNNGLLINIIQTCEKKSTRFTHSDFQTNGNVLALVNNDAYIYIIDFRLGKFWKLKQLESCTHIKFSECSESQLLVGKTSGVLEVLNIDSGEVLAKLLGHQHPVRSVSFTENNVCISASKYEAIMWDLNCYGKLQVLSLEKQCVLKFVFFVPISNHILVCYNDDIIQIWQNGSFENLKQFQPSNWRNHSVRSLSFSRNGKVMAVSGYLPVLALFQLDIWKLLKIINLPEYINSVKKIQFIPENFDAGCNRLLAILSGNGIIYFYNAQENILISELKSKCEISSFSIPLANSQYIACILCSGDVEVYDVQFFTMQNTTTIIENAQGSSYGKVLKLKNFCKKNGVVAKLQMDKILEIDKLKSIIKEYKEFPVTYRAKIWEKVLKLPNNIQQYNSIVDHMVIVAFPDLQEKFPLEDKVSIRCLRHLLSNIATWCPFFAQVEFLPFFLFPFVKVFHKKPIACFELCCTIIVNWCQHWFEYHPLPPVNVLAIIDNMLMEHDSVSLHHFSQCNVKPILYSWSLLENAFSEVLTTNQWLMFWDHVFINEPSFLLCSVVAFIMLHKKHILLLTKLEEFYVFFHAQKPLDIKKFLDKSYYVLNNTSGRNHPRHYLNVFTCLTCGSYPTFEEYPKEVVNFHVEHVSYLESQLNEMKTLKEDVLRKQHRQTMYDDDIELKNEEERRMIEVEKACIQRIKTYQENLMAQQKELKILRQELLDQENKIIANTRTKLRRRNNHLNAEKMKLLSEGLDMSDKINEVDMSNLEEAYKLRGLNLSKGDQNFEEGAATSFANPAFGDQIYAAHQETVKLKKQIKRAKADLQSPRKVDIALIMSTMNGLINKIKSELEKEKYSTHCGSVKEHLKVHELERETRELQREISQLLRLLSEKQGVYNSNSPPACSSQTCPNKTVRFSTSEF